MSVQFYNHSDYSLLESVITVESLINRARELGISCLALTDHNTTAGHGEFEFLCLKNGIKPIFGLELDVIYPDNQIAPLVILAKDQQGYGNLLHLASQKTPVLWERLPEYKDGLVILKGGHQSLLASLLKNGKRERAQKLHAWYSRQFGCNYYLRYEPIIGRELYDNFPEHPFILCQDVRYCKTEQRKTLEIIQRIGDRSPLVPDYPMLNWEYLTKQAPNEQVVQHTLQLASECNVSLPKDLALPPHPHGGDLTQAVMAGAKKRFPHLTREIESRLQKELAIITELEFSDYFLIVADIVAYAKQSKIPVGPGRGSAASSLVAYCLGITEVNPLKYGLLFERFLNKERFKRPDIDLDFCYERRQEILDYVVERFGPDHVAQIGTYGTFGKGAQQDVERLLGHPNSAISNQLQKLKRHRSTHAAGVVITEQKLKQITAVYSDRELPVTQLDMYSLERLGVLKIDLLGLRTLTLLREMEQAVQRNNPGFSLDTIPLADEGTYNLLAQGKSSGIFQLESSLFQDMLRALQPNSFQDLVALLALGRPGPLDVFPEYLKRRKNPKQVTYFNEDVKKILSETYGLILYQEQILLLANKIGGLSLGEADLFRIALSKGQNDKVQAWRRRFLMGAQKNGFTGQQGEALFRNMERFSGYAFNKAHSVSYALLTWQGAYLKANYPREFFKTLLNKGVSYTEQRDYLLECQSLGVKVLPPSVMYSQPKTIIEGQGLRLGLTAIRGFNSTIAKKIVQNRLGSLWENLGQLQLGLDLNPLDLEQLVLAGACDDLGPRNISLRQLNEKSFGELELLKRERDLLGIYCSSHPSSVYLPLLRNLRGDLQVVAGEVLAVRQMRGQLRGILDTPEGSLHFSAALNRENSKIVQGQDLAIFGEQHTGIWQLKWYLSLGPMLLISPELEQLDKLKTILANERGSKPVILRLGDGAAYHLLPREFWVEDVVQITQRLEDAKLTQVWFDPWKQNVS